MSSGFNEISLALFTTLAPAGAVAFVIVALVRMLMGVRDVRCGDVRAVGDTAGTVSADSIVESWAVCDSPSRLDRMVAIPFAIALVGFIASATHLGTPANALHVFSGVGRSPLSNEVFAAVLFLALAGSYWMAAFSERFPAWLVRPWLAAASLAAITFVGFTSLAYSVSTVPTWDTAWTPAVLVFQAVAGGCLVALPVLCIAGVRKWVLDRLLIAVSAVALVGCCVVYAGYGSEVLMVANNEFSAASLVPHYAAQIAVCVVSGFAGIIAAASSMLVARQGLPKAAVPLFVLRLVACVLMLGATFGARLMFYQLHMTVGF
ncbi:DmsC/YnfH family molybdoenzyme membrane anchor subunit [Adlercreutzia sp. ZJ138]|uniref:dimethyl sulfoxide reductase anchor subunit family protein n=1 Tax=Adlercreutzia sp. ZJ138 TaxID=2709405 RepID=UPI0013EBACFA|nr:DmsC/YnfH family molybdoenzyme membrane anchor subunit [Adlercreutzia sp. ZJ138]